MGIFMSIIPLIFKSSVRYLLLKPAEIIIIKKRIEFIINAENVKIKPACIINSDSLK